MVIEEFELENGIRVIFCPEKSSIAHFGVLINVGSRDESIQEWGTAHFLEHVMFKGTAKRKAFHILSRLDAVGGELNAYTTKEDTVLFASFLKDYLERAIELLSDIIVNSTFPNHEIEKEKEVVVDEINSYKDSPVDLIFEEIEELIFDGHSLGREILGTEDQVRQLNQTKIKEFVKKFYIPENIVLSCVGDFEVGKLKRMLEKYFGVYASAGYTTQRDVPLLNPAQSVTKSMDVFQSHSIIGSRAYASTDKNKTALILLNNLLGGPAMNSRLNLNVREKHGLTYNIESNYNPYSDCGVFNLYYGTDVKNQDKADALIRKELKDLCTKKLGVNQLHSAKTQMIGQIALGLESKQGLMLSLGKSKLMYEKIDTFEESMQNIQKVTAEEILMAANETFSDEFLFSLRYEPK